MFCCVCRKVQKTNDKKQTIEKELRVSAVI